MSSKLALLLQQKAKHAEAVDSTAQLPPAKRQRKSASNTQLAAAAHDTKHIKQPPAGEAPATYDDENDDDVPASAEAYSALVGMLSNQQGSLDADLDDRQLQQGDASDASESESEESRDEDSPTDSGDGELTSETEQAAAAAAAADADTDHQSGSSSSSGDDHPDDGPAAAAANGNTKPNTRLSRQAANTNQQQPDNQPAAAAGPSSSSTWDWFTTRELSDVEVSELSSGRPTYRELTAEQDPTEGIWKRAKWHVSGRSSSPASHSSLGDYGVKERLITRWREVHQADAQRLASHHSASTSAPSSSSSKSNPQQQQQQQSSDFTSRQQQVLFALCDSYSDVLFSAKPYPGGPEWSPAVPDESVDAVLLHVLNHCAKTADVIKKNNDKIKTAKEGDLAAIPRDQGFTRPKALILLPMRNMAYQLVRRLVTLAQKETRADSVQGKEKFIEQFVGENEDDDVDAQQQQVVGEQGKQKTKGIPKPAEHRALFRGNKDDHFRLGIRITRGQIKIFADLYQSDIIIASPLGLATKLAEDAAAAAAAGVDRSGSRSQHGANGPTAAAAAGSSVKGSEVDFLSSIEVCVLERADVMLMQNWQHVITVLDSLNRLPKQQHGSDIMRVRQHLLASQGLFYRQTIITTSFLTPGINAAFNQLCCSHAGKFKLFEQPVGVLGQVVPQVRQVFERFSAASSAAAADARFEFFKLNIWPRLSEGATAGLMMFVPSYFDVVRLRSFAKSEEYDFAVLDEYCNFRSATRTRALFFQRQKRILVYSERAHFYERYRIRGIQNIVFYGLPDHAHYYSELVNLVQSGSDSATAHHATITILFCKYDALALSRVVGQSRAAKMLAADTQTFMFC